MSVDFQTFKDRADHLLAAIASAADAAGRQAGEISLLPVTKNHPESAVDLVYQYGLRSVGENRVKEAVEKQGRTKTAVTWELIGHLQSNKSALAVAHFDRIQSVDSIKLIDILNTHATAAGKRLRILLQINAGNDAAKFGADPGAAAALLERALQKPQLVVEGLMTVAPLSDDAYVAQKTFENLRNIRDELSRAFGVSLNELSMGMSGDFTEAIREGSTQVRVGTALFGNRA